MALHRGFWYSQHFTMIWGPTLLVLGIGFDLERNQAMVVATIIAGITAFFVERWHHGKNLEYWADQERL